MEIKRYIFFITLYAALLFCIFSINLYALAGPAAERYSFRFENCTISEALREISQKSGVTIILKSDINKTIQIKSYTNRTLDRIITDLFRGENCAVVWNYNKGILASIGLYTFEKDSKGSGRRFTPDITSPVREAEAVIDRNNEVLPIVHDNDSISADENRAVAANYQMTREVAINGDADNNLPGARFPGISRTMRRVNGTGDITTPGSADDSGAVNQGADEATVIGEGVNDSTLEPPPGVPDETSLPPLPEAPDPNNFNGLEPPPMPPGMDM